MSDVVLKPCPNPWCEENRGYAWRIRCDRCGLEGPAKDTEAEAIAAWNARAALSTHEAAPVNEGVVERARELLAAEYEAVDMPAAAEVVRVCPRFNEQGPYAPALRAIERALTASGLDEAKAALQEIEAMDDGRKLNWGHAQDAIDIARTTLAKMGRGE